MDRPPPRPRRGLVTRVVAGPGASRAPSGPPASRCHCRLRRPGPPPAGTPQPGAGRRRLPAALRPRSSWSAPSCSRFWQDVPGAGVCLHPQRPSMHDTLIERRPDPGQPLHARPVRPAPRGHRRVQGPRRLAPLRERSRAWTDPGRPHLRPDLHRSVPGGRQRARGQTPHRSSRGPGRLRRTRRADHDQRRGDRRALPGGRGAAQRDRLRHHRAA